MDILHVVPTAPSDAWGPLPPHSCARNRPRAGVLRGLERLLLTVAVICLGYYGYVQAEALLYQRYENAELDRILASRVTVTPVTAPSAPVRPQPPTGSLIGRIEIPRLGVSAVVRAGSDAKTLRLAVGHIPGTALPGDGGNVGLAAHRDTFFRRLRDVRTGDDVRVTTTDGTYTYRVERTDIVNPTDVWVLDPTERPVLTLVTCYPFTYVGSAPQRFIVRAALSPADRAATLN